MLGYVNVGRRGILAVVLAYSRERSFFYAYYALRTAAGMICEGTTLCLSLAYVVSPTLFSDMCIFNFKFPI